MFINLTKIWSCWRFTAYAVSENQNLYQNVFKPHRFIQGLLMFPIEFFKTVYIGSLPEKILENVY